MAVDLELGTTWGFSVTRQLGGAALPEHSDIKRFVRSLRYCCSIHTVKDTLCVDFTVQIYRTKAFGEFLGGPAHHRVWKAHGTANAQPVLRCKRSRLPSTWSSGEKKAQLVESAVNFKLVLEANYKLIADLLGYTQSALTSGWYFCNWTHLKDTWCFDFPAR